MDAALSALDRMDVDKDGKVSYPEYLLALKFNKIWNEKKQLTNTNFCKHLILIVGMLCISDKLASFALEFDWLWQYKRIKTKKLIKLTSCTVIKCDRIKYFFAKAISQTLHMYGRAGTLPNIVNCCFSYWKFSFWMIEDIKTLKLASLKLSDHSVNLALARTSFS